MTVTEQIITISMCALATVTTRFLPFLVFSEKRKTPPYIEYLGKVLPLAVFGMLIIYCLKGVSFFSGNHAIPELIGIAVTALLHLWKKQMLVSIAGGTIVYMLLIRFVF